MECEKLLQEICNELAENMDSEVCERLRKHLESCSDCQQQLTAMRNTVKLFNCLKAEDVPQQIHHRLAVLLNMDPSNIQDTLNG
jgi:hypothetical protein